MHPGLSDTALDAEQVRIQLLRSAPAWRKVALLGEMCETVRLLALSGLRSRYPGASPEELDRRLAGILLGAELAEAVYGPLPEGGVD